jgi:hypothetical protein
MDSNPDPQPRRPILIGAIAALVAGLVSAILLLVLGRPGEGPPPASEGGLVVEAGPRAETFPLRTAPGATASPPGPWMWVSTPLGPSAPAPPS